MYKSNLILIIGVIPFFIMPKLSAQLIIDGQLRTKFEFRDGYKTLLPTGTNAAYVITQRTRLNFKYQTEKLKTLVSVQDVRLWGDNVYKTDVPAIDVYEAWGEILFTESLSLKIGRQELKYDKNRLLGTRNWNDVGATHDVTLLKFSKNNFKIHGGFAINNAQSSTSKAYYPLNFYKSLVFVWLTNGFDNGFKFSFIGLADTYQKENTADTSYTRTTFGGNLYYDNSDSKVGFHGAAYYQSGKDITGTEIDAYFFSSILTFTLNEKLKLLGAIDYFSGNDALSSSDTKTSFNKLYGNGHGYYGYMDYFTDVEKHTKGGGLMDWYMRLDYKFGDNSNLELTYHNFSFTNNVIDPESPDPLNPEAANKSLGSEIDMVFNYKYTKAINFKFGYSMMFATKSMEILKNGNNDRFANWAWIMVTLKPTLFKQEKENN
jgi:hypothetical protein